MHCLVFEALNKLILVELPILVDCLHSSHVLPFSYYLHMSGHSGVAMQDVQSTGWKYVDCRVQMIIAEGPRWL